jgi:ABC-type uncharacterized transport system permease subunit
VGIVSINRDPSRRQLNQFGFIWLGFLAVFGGIAWYRFENPTVATWLWIAAVAVPVVGWLVPPFMRLVFVGMSYLAWPIGFVVSHVVLAVVYYLVLTPIGLLMRLVGYDPMTRRAGDAGSSRWVARSTDNRGIERYFRQF